MPPIIPFQDCCTNVPECPPLTEAGPPGPPGVNGTNGTDGTNGVNAYTFTTDEFIMPAISGTVTVDVVDSAWGTIGQALYVESAGYMELTAKPSATQMTLENLGVQGNASPLAVIGTNRQISPSGIPGAAIGTVPIASGGTGQTTAAAGFNALGLGILTNQGDLLGRNATDLIRLAIGTNGQFLTVDTGQPGRTAWATLSVNLTSQVTGSLPLANGGTGGTDALTGFDNLSPLTQAGGLIVFDGTNNVELPPPGTDGLVLKSDSTALEGVSWQSSPSFASTSKTTVLATPYNVVAADVQLEVDLTAPGATAIFLPAGTANRIIRFTDGKGDAATNNITITPFGAETIAGGATYVINNNRGSIAFYFSGTDWKPFEYISKTLTVAEGGTGTKTGSITPIGNWVMTRNAVAAITVTDTSAVVNSLYIDQGRSGFGTATPVERVDISGNLQLKALGNKMLIKEGVNASMGVATLATGTVTVANTLVTANSRIELTVQNINGSTALGLLSVGTVVANTSFVINSRKPADATIETNDASIVMWKITEPAP